MIDFGIRFRNPFRCSDFRAIWNKTSQLSQYKCFEIQLSHYAFNWFELAVDLNWRQTDHAGPWITVNIFGLTLDTRVHDSRHWNDNTGTWEIY
jgi:hypothetical protein